MARGFLIKKTDGSYVGWSGHENAINRTKFPEVDFEFVIDDDTDSRVVEIRAEMAVKKAPGVEQMRSEEYQRLGLTMEKLLEAVVESNEGNPTKMNNLKTMHDQVEIAHPRT